MTWYMIILIFMLLLGLFTLAFQIFKITESDAKSRGLKHPKLWGLFVIGGNNGSNGLLPYLIFRNKHPSNMDESEKAEINSRKNKAIVSLFLIAIGSIGLIYVLVFM